MRLFSLDEKSLSLFKPGEPEGCWEPLWYHPNSISSDFDEMPSSYLEL